LQRSRKQIYVNMPTRWAIQYKVAQSIMDSKVSFISAVNDPAWAVLGGHADEVRKTVNGELGPFWDEVEMLLSMLKPFAQAIHQLEGDRPHLADCHVALLQLEEHVNAWAAQHADKNVPGKENKGTESASAFVVQTFRVRLGTVPGGMSAPVYNAAYSAAYALDPYYSQRDETATTPIFTAPKLSAEHMEKVRALVERVGGETAKEQFNKLFTAGFPRSMQPFVLDMVTTRETPVGNKRKIEPGARERMNVWEKLAMRCLSCVMLLSGFCPAMQPVQQLKETGLCGARCILLQGLA
jgi:hypothetical protein